MRKLGLIIRIVKLGFRSWLALALIFIGKRISYTIYEHGIYLGTNTVKDYKLWQIDKECYELDKQYEYIKKL